MRNSLFLFLVFTSMLCGGCKNNKIDIKKALIGTWELRKKTAGPKNVSTTFKPGNRILLVFTENRFHEFSRGQVASMGHYRIIDDTLKLSGKISKRLIFKPEVYPEDT